MKGRGCNFHMGNEGGYPSIRFDEKYHHSIQSLQALVAVVAGIRGPSGERAAKTGDSGCDNDRLHTFLRGVNQVSWLETFECLMAFGHRKENGSGCPYHAGQAASPVRVIYLFQFPVHRGKAQRPG